MHLRLYCSDNILSGYPANERFDPLAVFALLTRLRDQQNIPFEIIDVSSYQQADLGQAYDSAVTASIWKQYAIRAIRHSKDIWDQ